MTHCQIVFDKGGAIPLYGHGRAIRNALRAANESVQTLGRTLQGRVRLSVPSGYGQLAMADWLIAFKRLHPGIVLDVMFENRVEDLLRDEVDIAVRVMSEPPQNVVARDMGAVRYVACASPVYAREYGLPCTLDALRTTLLIIYMPDRYRTRAASTFVDFMLEQTKKTGGPANPDHADQRLAPASKGRTQTHGRSAASPTTRPCPGCSRRAMLLARSAPKRCYPFHGPGGAARLATGDEGCCLRKARADQ